ncbi:MAG TPA: p-hydroxycinnamoyl CoA hydratase/lyase [Alphaproteobacteria bacterium]|nr:p-hydroxycinnamoyl CoA hydratase/lyase [Alphaproteobacteria bacterium]
MATRVATKRKTTARTTKKASKKEVRKFETVLVEKEDGIAWVIMNRPEKRNAMSPQLHLDMNDALEELAIDDDIDVVIITGAGKAFSAGQDIRLYFRGTQADPVMRHRSKNASHHWRWTTLSKFPKLTIAMVNGFCFGGAFTQVSACDLAIAADDAIFGLSEINWGILPGGVVSWNVVNTMSFRDAMYYAITGDTFTGKEAAAMRFVNKSVPKSRLKAETLKLAKKMMKKNPTAVRYTKEAIRAVKEMSVDQAADYLGAKSDALKYSDPENGRQKGMAQFLDDKTYRPGLGEYDRKKEL